MASRTATLTKSSVAPASTTFRLKGRAATVQQQSNKPIQLDANQSDHYNIVINIGRNIAKDLLQSEYKICIGIQKALTDKEVKGFKVKGFTPDEIPQSEYVLANVPVDVSDYLTQRDFPDPDQIIYPWTPSKEFKMAIATASTKDRLGTKRNENIDSVLVKPGQSYTITDANALPKVLDDDNGKKINKDVIVFHNKIKAGPILYSSVGGVTQDVVFSSNGLWVPGRGEINIKDLPASKDPRIQVWFSNEQDEGAIIATHESRRSPAAELTTAADNHFYYDNYGAWEAFDEDDDEDEDEDEYKVSKSG